MIKFVEYEKGKQHTIIETKTIAKGVAPYANREQRRGMYYEQPVRRLINKIHELRKEMKKSSIKLPSFPKFNNLKVLSGHKSQLHALIMGK